MFGRKNKTSKYDIELIHLRTFKEICLSFFEQSGIYPQEILKISTMEESKRICETKIDPLYNPFQYNIFMILKQAITNKNTNKVNNPGEKDIIKLNDAWIDKKDLTAKEIKHINDYEVVISREDIGKRGDFLLVARSDITELIKFKNGKRIW